MILIELILTAVALSMDAFAVAMCKGLSLCNLKKRHMLTVGLYFGGFQAMMPLIGYFLGSAFKGLVESFSAWIAFGLLLFIGANMLKESFEKDGDTCTDSFSVGSMITLSVATSIDAMAAGVAFAMEPLIPGLHGILVTVVFIGITTFCFSAVGVKVGNVFGKKYKSKAEFTGGVVLIGLGLKILLEHLLG